MTGESTLAHAMLRHQRPRVWSVKRLLAAALFASIVVAAGCTSGDRSVNLDELRTADAAYYYVGPSFDGHDASHIERYRAGVASIIYGTCDLGDDDGCSPPLEI